MKKPIVDLETVNPLGRFDVLAYKGIGEIVKEQEKNLGLSGIWDVLKPHANALIVGSLGTVEVPPVIRFCLGAIQSHLSKQAIKDEGMK